jgi:hypothetical protein
MSQDKQKEHVLFICTTICRWQHGRRRGSAAARLLGLWVRDPPEECCVLSGRSFCVGLITVQRSPTECGVSECDRETSTMRRPRRTRGCCAMEKRTHM